MRLYLKKKEYRDMCIFRICLGNNKDLNYCFVVCDF